jgi:drug/metabolite transporter (DMT)-like permease
MMSPYTGQEFKDVKAGSSSGAAQKAGLFCFFVLTRAIHPTIIDASKTVDEETGKRGLAYGNMTVVLGECFFTLIAGALMAVANGKTKLLWDIKSLKVFCAIGFMYALGDYLEMASMGALGGAAYQVLLQSKLVITALMVWYMKGEKQAPLQWNILVLIMLSMCCYMMGGDSDGGDGGIPIMGVINVLLKVTVSCLCAVLADKYMKDFKSLPFYVQLTQMKVAWTLVILMISFTDGKTWQEGFFKGWTPTVWGVFASFTVKCWSTMAILSLLDSVLKNIGEASAVLVIYIMNVSLPYFPDVFEVPSFMAVMVVILSVTAYVGSKDVVAKAAKYDASLYSNKP